MTEQTHSDPLARLLAMGESGISEEWADYATMGIGPGHIPDLVRLVADGALLLDASRGNESWAPVHAWRALGQLRAKEAIEPLLSLFHLIDEEDLDDVAEDGPVALGMIGPAAVEPAAGYLADASNGLWTRVTASTSLREIGTRHPEARQACIDALARQLSGYAEQERILNADVIYALVELKATEAAPLMALAFEADAVDLNMMGDWEDVQIALGLLEERLTPRPGWGWDGDQVEAQERSAAAREQRQRTQQAAKKSKAKRKNARKARKGKRR